MTLRHTHEGYDHHIDCELCTVLYYGPVPHGPSWNIQRRGPWKREWQSFWHKRTITLWDIAPWWLYYVGHFSAVKGIGLGWLLCRYVMWAIDFTLDILTPKEHDDEE